MRQIRIIISAAFVLLALAVYGQQNPSTPAPGSGGMKGQAAPHAMPSADDQLKNLTDRLSLTADQQAKIKPILEDTHAQAQTLMQDNSLSQDDRRTKMRSLHESASAKIRDVLNDDQKKKFDAWQQEMRTQHAGGEKPPK